MKNLVDNVGKVNMLKTKSDVANETMNNVVTWFLVFWKFRRAEMVIMLAVIPLMLSRLAKTPAKMPSVRPKTYSVLLQDSFL